MHISGGLDLFFIRVLPSTQNKIVKNLSLSLNPKKDLSLSLSTRTNPRLMEKRSDRSSSQTLSAVHLRVVVF